MASEFGLIGIGVMGRNLSLNFLSKNISLAVYDVNQDQLDILSEKTTSDLLSIFSSLENFVLDLYTPRKIMLMVKAGEVTDSVIQALIPLLTSGDIIIDGGNANYLDTERRINELEKYGIDYLGTGISGGAKGARYGPSIMPGGSKEAWEKVKPYLQKIAAETDDGVPCCQYIGSGGAGHFVKTIHNGIEYSDMQLITESYDILKTIKNISSKQQSDIFARWNNGKLSSYLVQITAKILGKVDQVTNKPLLDFIQDSASQKGTGKWSVHSSLDYGVPSTLIATAVFQRFISSLKDMRVNLATKYEKPELSSKDLEIPIVEEALYAAKLLTYSQGFSLLSKASIENKWDLDLSNIAQVWSAGCIIRSQVLSFIQSIFKDSHNLTELLDSNYFNKELQPSIHALRQISTMSISYGISLPGHLASIAYFDSMTRSRLPANLLQAQRDFFGSHGYQRIDDDSIHHTDWEN